MWVDQVQKLEESLLARQGNSAIGLHYWFLPHLAHWAQSGVIFQNQRVFAPPGTLGPVCGYILDLVSSATHASCFRLTLNLSDHLSPLNCLQVTHERYHFKLNTMLNFSLNPSSRKLGEWLGGCSWLRKQINYTLHYWRCSAVYIYN